MTKKGNQKLNLFVNPGGRTRPLDHVLDNKTSYIIPPYQRDYTWKEENWEDLLDTIENAGGESFLPEI